MLRSRRGEVADGNDVGAASGAFVESSDHEDAITVGLHYDSKKSEVQPLTGMPRESDWTSKREALMHRMKSKKFVTIVVMVVVVFRWLWSCCHNSTTRFVRVDH